MLFSKTIQHPICFNEIKGETSTNELHKSIQQSIRLILTTVKGELLGDPEFGSDFMKNIYETNSEIRQLIIDENIRSSIAKYENRIIIENITYTELDSDTLSIVILYKLKQLNEAGKVNFSVRTKQS